MAIGEWPFCPHGFVQKQPASVHARERAVVYENPLTGQVRYPGRADVPMPARYAAMGYQKREFVSAHELSRFEKEKGVANESLNCHSGNTLEVKDPTVPKMSGPVIQGGDSSLTVNGVSVKLRSRNG